MPYASPAALSTSPLDGGIEITDKQYQDAITHLSDGYPYFIEQGRLVLATRPEQVPGHHSPKRINGEWVHEPLPEPEIVQPGPDPIAASIRAVTPGTPEHTVFTWMRGRGAIAVPVLAARMDINMNLTTQPMLGFWLSGIPEQRAAAAAGLDYAIEEMWKASALTTPSGHKAIVEAWRDTYRLRAS